MSHARLAVDRSILVPRGSIVKTGYVPIDHVSLACKDRMAIGDVTSSFHTLMQLVPDQLFPPPTGHWQGDRFVITDGRHMFIAALMLGYDELLVSWLVERFDE